MRLTERFTGRLKKSASYLVVFLLSAILIGIGMYLYRDVLRGKAAPVIAVIAFLIVYGIGMTASEKGRRRLIEYRDRHSSFTLPPKKRPLMLWYSILSLIPVYICLFIASLLPITTWEVWFVTVFPCVVIAYLPIRSVGAVLYSLTHYRLRFWLIQICIAVGITLVCQAIISAVQNL